MASTISIIELEDILEQMLIKPDCVLYYGLNDVWRSSLRNWYPLIEFVDTLEVISNESTTARVDQFKLLGLDTKLNRLVSVLNGH